MEISSDWVGMKSRPHTIEITPRMAMNYAAGVNDNNPAYFDDERPGGIAISPMLAVALTWPMSANFESYWEAKDFPMDVLTRQVHYSEVLTFNRPMRPGESLTIRGELVALENHRAGTHIIMQYTARDKRDETVFTECIGGMLRKVALTGGDRSAGAFPRVAPAGESDANWEERFEIDALAAHRYDGCSGIHFPIHTSPAFAHAVGLPDIIYHGTATLAHAAKAIVNREADGDPARIREIGCHFTGMVPLNSSIQVAALKAIVGTGHTSVPFSVLNQTGEKAIRNGWVTVNTAE